MGSVTGLVLRSSAMATILLGAAAGGATIAFMDIGSMFGRSSFIGSIVGPTPSPDLVPVKTQTWAMRGPEPDTEASAPAGRFNVSALDIVGPEPDAGDVPTGSKGARATVTPSSSNFPAPQALPTETRRLDPRAVEGRAVETGPDRFAAAFATFGLSPMGANVASAKLTGTGVAAPLGFAASTFDTDWIRPSSAAAAAAVTAIAEPSAVSLRGTPMPGLPLPRPRAERIVAPAASIVVASISPIVPAAEPRSNSPIAAEPVITVDLPRKMPKGANAFLDLIKREAKTNAVPLWIALGVIWVESKFDPDLRGKRGVMGMMQVMPSTARYLGYTGTNEGLLDPDTNVRWGMKELGKVWKLSKGDVCLTAAKYKGGFMTKSINTGAWRYCEEMHRATGMDYTGLRVGPVKLTEERRPGVVPPGLEASAKTSSPQ